jgi:hypothetical protein
MSDSMTRRLPRRRSTREQKSAREWNGPSAWRAVDDRLDGALSDVLDREEPEADGVAFDREFDERTVDVGRPNFDPEPAAFGHGGGDLFFVVPEGGQHRSHVFDGVVRLQVRGLVSDQAVAGGVGLVEAVALERLEGIEDGVDDLRRHASLGSLADELARASRP